MVSRKPIAVPATEDNDHPKLAEKATNTLLTLCLRDFQRTDFPLASSISFSFLKLSRNSIHPSSCKSLQGGRRGDGEGAPEDKLL